MVTVILPESGSILGPKVERGLHLQKANCWIDTGFQSHLKRHSLLLGELSIILFMQNLKGCRLGRVGGVSKKI